MILISTFNSLYDALFHICSQVVVVKTGNAMMTLFAITNDHSPPLEYTSIVMCFAYQEGWGLGKKRFYLGAEGMEYKSDFLDAICVFFVSTVALGIGCRADCSKEG